jgi:hypothetical protein
MDTSGIMFSVICIWVGLAGLTLIFNYGCHRKGKEYDVEDRLSKMADRGRKFK